MIRLGGAKIMFQQSKGKVTSQAHVGIPAGTYEDEHGRQGFYGRASHLYHQNRPTSWTRIEGPCRPQAFNTHKTPLESDVWQASFILENEDVKIGTMRPTGKQPYYFRNADGDTCYFIHEGRGLLETDFGPLKFERGDYLVIPKGTTIRFVSTEGEQKYLVIESRAEMTLPEKGLLGKHALFDPGMLQNSKS
ncbi:unnamed protein product [Sphagnum balticum]